MKSRFLVLLCFAFAANLVAGSVSAADPNLVGWWKLDETSGMTAADSSGYGNDGTLSGSLYGDSWAAGLDGGALGFNWDGYVNCGKDASLNITGDFTIGAWAKPAPGSEASYMGIGGRLVSSPTYMGFALVRHSSGVYRLWTANKDTAAVVGASSSKTYTASEWHHVVGVRTGSTCSLYVDGVKAGSADVPVMAPSSEFFHLGLQYANSPTDRLWIGLIDDFRLFSRGLTEAELTAWVGTKALNPSPADGATEVLMGLLQWTGTPTAKAYDVYVGTNPTPGAAESLGRVGLGMTFYPMPLQPGATYYWRVDAVDDAGNVNQGSIWRFTVMPMTAHVPSPIDGARWVGTNIKASWTKGQTAASHTLYGGTDRAAVAAGDASALLGVLTETSFDASALLQPGTTYYWRIDEVDGAGTVYPGDVWTFSTFDPAGGAVAEYWDNMTLTGEPKVVKTVPEINFDWGDGPDQGVNSPDPCIPTNQFSCRWTAELNVPVTGKYVLYEASDDGARMWLNNEQVANGWWDRGTTEDRTFPLDLVAGQRYLLVMEQYENGGGATAFLRWSGPGIPKQIIPQGALQIPQIAFGFSPAQGATNVADTPVLSWRAGKTAAQHDVYFGTDEALVAAGDRSVFQSRIAETSFTPAGVLTWATTYYWKVDEVAADGTIVPGMVLSFTVIDRTAIDDFESYDVVPVAPTAAPIGWWKFDGDANDSSGNGHNGVLNSDPTFVAGVDGQAIHMDGVDDYVVVGSVGISGTMPRTIAGWAKADTTSIVDWTNVFGFTSTPDGVSGLSFDIDKIGGANQYCIHVYGWERGYLEIDLEWHHLAASYDGTTVKWYGDGKLAGSEAWAINTQDNVQMGKRGHAAGGNWPGCVDDVRIYDTVLSLAEIKSLAGFTPTAVVNDVWSQSGTVTETVVTDTVHGGSQALLLDYDNANAPHQGGVSRAVALTDWTRGRADALSLWFHGDPCNAPAPLCVIVQDSAGATGVVTHPNPAAVQIGQWQKWTVSLAYFSAAGVKLTSVAKVAIGVGDGHTSGAGTVFIDDVAVVRSGLVVDNFSFEQHGRADSKAPPDGHPRLKGFDRVPGWSTDRLPSDSGVEMAAQPTDGQWSAYLKGGDPSVWQLTAHAIEETEVFQLDVDTRVTKGAVRGEDNLRMTLYYDDNGARVRVATASLPVPYLQPVTCTLVFKAADVPKSVGHKIGMEFANAKDNWISLDNVRLRAR
jgi:hypothetical protein